MGPFARVEVWRDAASEPKMLYYHGDLERCSHPPSSYHSVDGALLDVVANRPVTDDNRAEFAALHAKHRDGLTKAETLSFGSL